MNLLGKISAFFLCLSLAGCSGREAASQKKSELEGQVSMGDTITIGLSDGKLTATAEHIEAAE